MKFDDFIHSVDNLVREWATDEPTAGAIPRDALQAIYDQVCNDTAWELAQAQRKLEEACAQLHKLHLEGVKR